MTTTTTNKNNDKERIKNNNGDDNNGSSSVEFWNNLEESPMFFWMGFDIWKNPANVLLISSIPFFAGAYVGYKKPTEKLEELAVGSSSNNNKIEGDKVGGIPTAERRRLGLKTASRALRLATMGSVGTFGMLGAFGFYVSGYRSIDECIESTTRWATSWRQSFEIFMGVGDRPSNTHPEVLATKHMSEDEVLNYVYEKYIKEEEEKEPKKETTEPMLNEGGIGGDEHKQQKQL